MTDSKKNDEPSPATANASEARKYKRGRPRSRKIKDDGAADDSVLATQSRRAPESIGGGEMREARAEEPAKPPAPAVAADAVSTPEKTKPPPEPARPEPAAAPETLPSNGGPPHPGPGNQGEWQDRNFWRRNKRKRGRYGGSWQPGPGGGGGGSSHPQQPTPPSQPSVSGDLPDSARLADAAALDALAREIGSGSAEPLVLNRLYPMNLPE